MYCQPRGELGLQEKASCRILKVSVLCLLLLDLFANFTPKVDGYPSDLTTDNTLFMQYFKEWYDYVHFAYDTTGIALSHANLTADEYENALSRWTLAWHPLMLTFAYEKTGDRQYLMEAKYFVDNLYATTSHPDHSLIITPRNRLGGLQDADIPMVWAMQKLNEYFGQSYDVIEYVTQMKSKARYNNATDLAWNAPWTDASPALGVTFDEELMAMTFLAYLDHKGVGSYATDVQKMYTYLERYRSQDFYPYGDKIPGIRPDMTATDMTYLLAAYHYFPSAFNTTRFQLTINAFVTTNNMMICENSYVALGAMAELAVWKGLTINERLTTAHYQTFKNFKLNSAFISANQVTQGVRQIIVDAKALLFALYFTDRTSKPSYVYGGYRNYPSHGAPNVYQVNSTIGYNNTDAWGTVKLKYEGVSFLTLWGGIGWDWDAFAYNSSLAYYQGYKKGRGSLLGNDLTVRIWENFKKAQAEHKNYNNNTNYPDRLTWEYDAVRSPCYLLFTNGTMYSTASGNTRTVIGSNPIAWYEPQNGYLIFYKINDNSSATMKWTITVSGNARGLSASAKKFEGIPWIVPAKNPTDTVITSEAFALLTDYSNGMDMVTRDYAYSTSSEGSIRWQLKHFSGITIYTDKNMTGSSYDRGRLTFTISADKGQTSTTKIYVGDEGSPQQVTGATSWSYDDSTGILTVNKIHRDPVTITVIWADTLTSTIESRDSKGNERNQFDFNETVWVSGSGYSPLGLYNISVVSDVDWIDGMPLPRVAASVLANADASGRIPLTPVWKAPLKMGEYDIIVDVDGDGYYDAALDALDDFDIYHAGFFVIPEYILGTALSLAVCFVGLAVYRKTRCLKRSYIRENLGRPR